MLILMAVEVTAASFATVLSAVALGLGAIATVMTQTRAGKQSQLDLAWDMTREFLTSIKQENEDLLKRASLADQKFFELESKNRELDQKHRECEEARIELQRKFAELEAQIQGGR